MPCVSGGRGMTLEHPPLQGTLGALHHKANIDFPTGSWDSGNGGTCLQCWTTGLHYFEIVCPGTIG